jgi:hypothetical protein
VAEWFPTHSQKTNEESDTKGKASVSGERGNGHDA